MRYIDTHVHYDHPLFSEIRDSLMEWVHDEVIDYAIIPPIIMESNYKSSEMFPEDTYPWIRFAKGLHPKAVNNSPNWSQKTEDEFRLLLNNSRVVAVKSGLDFCKKRMEDRQKDRQRDYLRGFIKLAEEFNKPIILHIREAEDDMIEFLKENKLKTEAVAHCFCFGKDVYEQLVEQGVNYFGIGGALTRDDMDDLREAVNYMPIENILLETDGPFMKPKGYAEKVNSSMTLPVIAEKIAEIKAMDCEDVIRITYDNAIRFYRL